MLIQGKEETINRWVVQSLLDGSGKSLSVSQGRTIIHLDYETLEPLGPGHAVSQSLIPSMQKAAKLYKEL